MRRPTVMLLGVMLIACGPATQPPPSLPAGLVATSTSAPEPAPQVGYLEGRVTIGPLTPVERAGVPTPSVPPEVYAALLIDIYLPDGTTRIANAKVKPDGTYRVELAPGMYLVTVPRAGIQRGVDLPKTITIVAGQTARMDIDIDTGIR